MGETYAWKPKCDKEYNYWIVQLGKLYYAGGLSRVGLEQDDFSLEFANNEKVAFPFGIEKFAEQVAGQVGGTVIEKIGTFEEFVKQSHNHSKYVDSGEEWDDLQERDYKEALQKEKERELL